MASSKIVVDSVHGDIQPSFLEWDIIDTATFQRLRKLKQLQMAYLVYPNATHTRFAHSLGVLNIMKRIIGKVKESIPNVVDQEDLQLAALMHDIGHYPYSHLLEGIDDVILTEEHIGGGAKSAIGSFQRYPNHEEVGKSIITSQPDIQKILGKDRAERIANLFSGEEVTEPELSKLIHSSLDMDRLDYLIRDSQATGVPYGMVDINYLLNHIQRGEGGAVGISYKALSAAEHLLIARSFLFRVVCQHKTIFAFEETARQLLRRLRDRAQNGGKGHGIPVDGAAILDLVKTTGLNKFADSFLDEIFTSAAEDDDLIINLLANCIISRKPPKLLWEQKLFVKRTDPKTEGSLFKERCKNQLQVVADKLGFDVRQFLICDLKAIGFEKRGPVMSKDEALKTLASGEIDEMIRVFKDKNAKEPADIVTIPHSILHQIGGHEFRTYRLYFVPSDNDESMVSKIQNEINFVGA